MEFHIVKVLELRKNLQNNLTWLEISFINLTCNIFQINSRYINWKIYNLIYVYFQFCLTNRKVNMAIKASHRWCLMDAIVIMLIAISIIGLTEGCSSSKSKGRQFKNT